ncbi:MAG: hypothetical protein HDT13_01930 [Butyrivibrio sp.]|nr:hypothetical protein [Butyrivibrio sp.]
MIKKKIWSGLLLCACVAVLLFAGCSKSKSTASGGVKENEEVKKLIEASLEYIRENGQTVDEWEQAEPAFESWIAHSDAVKSLSERDDYAGMMMDMYMSSELPPHEATDAAMKTFKEQELMEVFLSQSSACGQLSKDDRQKLVKRMIANAIARENKEAYVLYYSSAFFKNIEWQGSSNEWYDAMRSMEFTSGEQWFMGRFYSECDAVQKWKADNGTE